MAVLGSNSLSHTTDFNFKIGSTSESIILEEGTGRVFIGSGPIVSDISQKLILSGQSPLTSSTDSFSVGITNRVHGHGAETSIYGYISDVHPKPNTTYTLDIRHYLARNLSSAWNTNSATITNQYGFEVSSDFTRGVNNYGFFSNVPSGSNRWNFYAGGTAPNFFQGIVYFGQTSLIGDSKSIASNELQSRRNTNASVTHIRFFAPAGQSGVINTTGATTQYLSGSDYRLKENIEDAPDASSDIDDINVRSFNWKYDGHYQKYGFIAQELVNILPEAVFVGGETEMWSVDNSKMVPMLVKEIQSLRQRISNLETMVGN